MKVLPGPCRGLNMCEPRTHLPSLLCPLLGVPHLLVPGLAEPVRAQFTHPPSRKLVLTRLPTPRLAPLSRPLSTLQCCSFIVPIHRGGHLGPERGRAWSGQHPLPQALSAQGHSWFGMTLLYLQQVEVIYLPICFVNTVPLLLKQPDSHTNTYFSSQQPFSLQLAPDSG